MFSYQKNILSHLHLKQVIQRIDHITYVTSYNDETNFIKRWTALGFIERNRLHTVKYPASHIVLVDQETSEYAWGTMTGLSVSSDPHSPINEFVYRYGSGVQHVAYSISPTVDMDELHEQMKSYAWSFMTPVLSYVDSGQARLKQLFIAPTVPYGPFIELVQRLSSPNGKTFDNFDIVNIDTLYTCYDEFSKKLLKTNVTLEKELT